MIVKWEGGDNDDDNDDDDDDDVVSKGGGGEDNEGGDDDECNDDGNGPESCAQGVPHRRAGCLQPRSHVSSLSKYTWCLTSTETIRLIY